MSRDRLQMQGMCEFDLGERRKCGRRGVRGKLEICKRLGCVNGDCLIQVVCAQGPHLDLRRAMSHT